MIHIKRRYNLRLNKYYCIDYVLFCIVFFLDFLALLTTELEFVALLLVDTGVLLIRFTSHSPPLEVVEIRSGRVGIRSVQ